MNGEMLDEILDDVPDDYRDRFREIVALTDQFCDEHLNDEYKLLTRELACHVCQKNSPANRGKAASWAAGVTYTIGWVNFLSDATSEPQVRTEDVAKGFGVSESTMMSKSRDIRNALQITRFDPEWCLPSMIDDNPLAWMFDVNGIIMDIRDAPREVQEEAFSQGLIPYIPADRQVKQSAADDVIAKIGPDTVLSKREAEAPPDFPGDLLSDPQSLFGGMFGEMEKPPPPKKRRIKGPAQIYTLRITLRHTKPPIWRRVAVPGDITLGNLHDIIQTVMGWDNCHMHQFITPEKMRFGSYLQGHGGEFGEHDEDKFRLHDIVEQKGDRFDYEYDFGDCWEHRIAVQRVDPPDPKVKYPVCLAGKLAAPVDDCGGVWGYYLQLNKLENPEESEFDEDELMLPADFDPEAFDLDAVNRMLRGVSRARR